MKKIKSLELLEHHELPILPYKVLSEQCYEKEIQEFLMKYRIRKFMVRTDSINLFSPSINEALVNDDTLTEIRNFFEQNYKVFVMLPGDLNKNFHSLNILYESDKIIIEIVGPGFIATDLNRKSLLHETIILDKNNFSIVSRKIFEKSYQRDRKNILNIQKNESSYLMIYKEYIPLTDVELLYIQETLPILQKIATHLKCNTGTWIASLSFLNYRGRGNEPIFWDMYCTN